MISDYINSIISNESTKFLTRAYGNAPTTNSNATQKQMDMAKEALLSLKGPHIRETKLVSEFAPVRQLSWSLDVSDKFRSEFNVWLIEMFGKKRTAYKCNGTILIHPNNAEMLKGLGDG